MNRTLIILGAVLIIAGFAWPLLRRAPLFRLPGDIVISRPGYMVSLAVSVIAWLLRR